MKIVNDMIKQNQDFISFLVSISVILIRKMKSFFNIMRKLVFFQFIFFNQDYMILFLGFFVFSFSIIKTFNMRLIFTLYVKNFEMSYKINFLNNKMK